MLDNAKQEKREKPAVVPVAYNIPDAAAAIGISTRSVYNLVDAGRLRLVKVGRRSIIPASDLRALLEVGAK